MKNTIKCNFCICANCTSVCVYKDFRCNEKCKYPYIICKNTDKHKGGELLWS